MALNVLVIHGYVQSAQTVARNTTALQSALSDIAILHYVDGPPLRDDPKQASRPWWYLGQHLQQRPESLERWWDTVSWWSNELSANEYDGIIGLSQGAAMAALLLSMLNDPSKCPGFNPNRKQALKFVIMCSGFVSDYGPHKDLYSAIPEALPSLHAVDRADTIVRPEETIRLKNRFPKSILLEHHEGHSIPVGGDWPQTMRDFILHSREVSTALHVLE